MVYSEQDFFVTIVVIDSLADQLRLTKINESLLLLIRVNSVLVTARAWKIAEVTPIPKSGNPEDPCNNRPIRYCLSFQRHLND